MTSFKKLSVKIYTNLLDYGQYRIMPPTDDGVSFYRMADRDFFSVKLQEGQLKVNDELLDITIKGSLIDSVVDYITKR